MNPLEAGLRPNCGDLIVAEPNLQRKHRRVELAGVAAVRELTG